VASPAQIREVLAQPAEADPVVGVSVGEQDADEVLAESLDPLSQGRHTWSNVMSVSTRRASVPAVMRVLLHGDHMGRIPASWAAGSGTGRMGATWTWDAQLLCH